MSKPSVCVFVIFIAALVAGIPPPESTDADEKPGYCKVGDVFIKEGESANAPIGECSRLTCVIAKPGNKQVTAAGCGVFQPGPGCHMTDSDNTKPYPDCCPKPVCDKH